MGASSLSLNGLVVSSIDDQESVVLDSQASAYSVFKMPWKLDKGKWDGVRGGGGGEQMLFQ